MTIELYLPDSIPLDHQTSVEFRYFLQAVVNRRVVGSLRYEPERRPTPKNRYMTRMKKEIDSYKRDGNFEQLLNIAVYAFLESAAPENKKLYFESQCRVRHSRRTRRQHRMSANFNPTLAVSLQQCNLHGLQPSFIICSCCLLFGDPIAHYEPYTPLRSGEILCKRLTDHQPHEYRVVCKECAKLMQLTGIGSRRK